MNDNSTAGNTMHLVILCISQTLLKFREILLLLHLHTKHKLTSQTYKLFAVTKHKHMAACMLNKKLTSNQKMLPHSLTCSRNEYRCFALAK